MLSFNDPFYSTNTGFGNTQPLLNEMISDIADPFFYSSNVPITQTGVSNRYRGNDRRGQIMYIDVAENDQMFWVLVELPGIPREKIDVNIENNLLRIKARKEKDELEQGEGLVHHRNERRFGHDQRTVRLPFSVDIDKAECNFCDGVLCVKFNKNAEREGVKKLTIGTSKHESFSASGSQWEQGQQGQQQGQVGQQQQQQDQKSENQLNILQEDKTKK